MRLGRREREPASGMEVESLFFPAAGFRGAGFGATFGGEVSPWKRSPWSGEAGGMVETVPTPASGAHTRRPPGWGTGPEGAARMGDMNTTSSPVTADELRYALTQLPRPVSVRAAALHLALPVGVVPAISVRTEGQWMRYRGNQVLVTDDPGADAARLAAAGHREGDQYLDLNGDALTWVKVLRSGVRRIAFGTDTLLGRPLLAVTEGIPVQAVHELLGKWEAEGASEGLASLPSGTFQVVGGGNSYLLQEALAPRQQVGRVVSAADVDRAATGLASELDGEATDVEFVNVEERSVDVDVTVRLEGSWEAVVPVRVGATSEVVGISLADVVPGAEERLPVGWTWKGRTLGGSPVGQHRGSLVTALLAKV